MTSVAIILAAALIGGLLAGRLRLPVIMGYLAVGAIAGPYSLGLVQDVDIVQTMASIGIVLLMFSLGMEFSFGDLIRVGKVGIGGGIAQIVLTSLFGYAVGRFLFSWPSSDAVFLGFMISMSSTMIVLKILIDRGETSSLHGRILMAILLVQDLAVVPLMVVLPALGHGAELMPSLSIALLKAGAFLGAMLVIGYWGIPLLLGHVARTRSREVFLISVLAISFGSAFSTTYFGVSQALGAFAAGMLISRSQFAHQALADTIPFRDAFAAVFFVSLGMLANPQIAVENWPVVLALVTAVFLGKFLLTSGIVRHFGYSPKTVLLVGAGLAQVGEFSFVLGQAGLATGVLSSNGHSIIISGAVVTMLITPAAFKIADKGYKWLSSSPLLSSLVSRKGAVELDNSAQMMSNHVVICGHGRAGGNLTTVLRKYGIPYVVIELNPGTVSDLRSQGVPCIFGDAGNPRILSLARVETARVLALTCPDSIAQAEATAYVKQANPAIDIVARLADLGHPGRLKSLGVSEVVDPAFEASLEFVRHILGYYGVPGPDVENMACPFLRAQDTGPGESSPAKV